MENIIRKLAHLYWHGEIDYIEEKYAALVIEYIENHKDEFVGYVGM